MKVRSAERGMRNGNRGITVWVVMLLLFPGAAGAQVGHNPGRSPYSDVRAKQAASLLGGYLRGQRGTPQAGPSDGPIFGVRYDRQVGTAAEVLLALGYARLDKYLIDPTVPEVSRLIGPLVDNVVFMEAGASLLLTGRKSWHGFVPYVGAMGGVVFETDLGTPSALNFGTRVALTPHIGIKWFPVQAIAFKVEARDIIWRIKYPEAWFVSQAPGIPPVLRTDVDKPAEWLHHPTLMISLGYTFTL